MRRGYPREIRLSRSSEFLLVKEKGRSFGGRFMVLGVLISEKEGLFKRGRGRVMDEPGWRVGVITSRKVGGAVQRNRVRRRFRELARLGLPRVPGREMWLVMVARRAAVDASWEELQKEWHKLLRRAGILSPRHEGEAAKGGPEPGVLEGGGGC